VSDDNSNPVVYFVLFDRYGVIVLCGGESVNRSQNGSKTDVIGFLCVSLDRRRACAFSETDFSSQNGDRA
jgi:hypothetical protein